MFRGIVLSDTSVLILTIFGAITALAWNDAFGSLFKGPCDSKDAGMLCKFSNFGPWIYSLSISAITVVIILLLNGKSYIKT